MLVVLLLRAYIAEQSRWGEPEEDGIVTLTMSNFDRFVSAYKQVVVLFTNKECKRCPEAANVFMNLEKIYGRGDDAVPFAQVDIDTEPDLAEINNIHVYPAIKVFTYNQPTIFPYLITEQKVVRFLNKELKAATPLLEADNEFDDLTQNFISYLFVIPQNDTAALETYHRVLRDYRSVPAAHSYDRARIPEYSGKATHILKVHRYFDDGNRIYATDHVKEEALRAFIDKVSYPDVIYFDQNSFQRLFEKNSTTMILFTAEHKSLELEVFKNFSREHKGKMLFAVAYLFFDVGKQVAKLMDVNVTDHNAVRMLSFASDRGRKFSCGSAEVEGFASCFEGFQHGKLQPYRRSQPIPLADESAVKVVVGDNFKQIVLDSSKDVVLLLHAALCYECEKLLPIFAALGEHLRSFPHIIAAQMDVVLNEADEVEYDQLPTVLLFAQGNKEPRSLPLPPSLPRLLLSLEEQLKVKLNSAETAEL